VSEQAFVREHRITPLELFFDLVFVFAFTQVTTVFLHDQSWAGLGHGILILAALWSSWAAYAWLTNTVDAGQDTVLAAIFVAMAAIFIAALAVPEAFGLHGVLFGVAFLVASATFLVLYALSTRPDQALFAAILRIAPSTLLCAALIVVAGFVDDWVKSALWVLALAVGFFGPALSGLQGFRLEPAHFVERHGLIVIIAIGESLFAAGLGARSTDLGAGVIAAAVLGLVVATAFWLAYFDFFPVRVQQRLEERRGLARISLARDAYSYLHLPMVAGIVLFAFAMEVTLAHVGSQLDTIPAFALCAGPALYLSAFVALRVRISGTVGGGRLVAAVACLALVPVARAVPALVALALVAAVWVALHAYELIWWREARAEARAALRLPT
jgi:low temperature requirement protein LtrA